MVSIAILFLLAYMFIWKPLFGDSLAILILFIPGLYLAFPVSSQCFTFMSPPKNCPVEEMTFNLIVLVAGVIAYFLIGVLFGWIYGKMGNKNT